jgi:acyl carrier protein
VSDTRERLVRCFQAVFPELTPAEAARASANRVATWDSVATSTLVAAVEEEFDVRFDPREIEKLTSFQAFLARLDRA